MDTKSKNSRKFGILILILLLAASSAVMMLQYGTIRRQIESVQEEGSRSGETAADMANTLAEGNYLLYNRYVRDTDPAEVLSLYGQQRFDLAEKYLDYELIDSKDEVIASDLPEEEQEKLHEDGKEYAFRVKYIFSENGDSEQKRHTIWNRSILTRLKASSLTGRYQALQRLRMLRSFTG